MPKRHLTVSGANAWNSCTAPADPTPTKRHREQAEALLIKYRLGSDNLWPVARTIAKFGVKQTEVSLVELLEEMKKGMA